MEKKETVVEEGGKERCGRKRERRAMFQKDKGKCVIWLDYESQFIIHKMHLFIHVTQV